ncbi:MAG: M24 family metallopeptidase [Armatimonadota bacterium]|nr:M24 family metallopeptidase [Armatimonadota bacterium]
MQRLVFPRIVQDGTDMVRPLVLSNGDTPVAVFVPEVEQAALAEARPARVVLHGYYFTWITEPRPDLATCLAHETGGSRIALDARAPAALHRSLTQVLPISLSPIPEPRALYATRLPRATVVAAWEAENRRLRDAARRAVTRLADSRARAAPEYRGPDRFTSLDRALEEAGLAAVFATSPLHVQAMTGLHVDDILQQHLSAVYLRGGQELILLSPSPAGGNGARSERFSDVADALAHLVRDALGYEDLHLSAGTQQFLLDHSLDLRPASGVLRRWETRMAGANAPGFLLAAMATVQGIEYAIGRAHEMRRIGRVLTEIDLDSAYQEAVIRFAVAVGLPNGILPYFNIVQVGERTVYPAVPTSAPITERTRTVKFDMGVRVVDGRGLVRGCSDVARTCAFGEAAMAMDSTLDHVLRESLPRALRAGIRGSEMYRSGVAALQEREPSFRALGYLPQGRTVEDYRRDCGHALGRQTPSSVHFLPHDDAIVEEGMVVCLELVWPMRDEVFAHEDIWLMSHDGPMNITRHTGWVWT